MFDEPIKGLDPGGVFWIRNLLNGTASGARAGRGGAVSCVGAELGEDLPKTPWEWSFRCLLRPGWWQRTDDRGNTCNQGEEEQHPRMLRIGELEGESEFPTPTR